MYETDQVNTPLCHRTGPQGFYSMWLASLSHPVSHEITLFVHHQASNSPSFWKDQFPGSDRLNHGWLHLHGQQRDLIGAEAREKSKAKNVVTRLTGNTDGGRV